MERETVADDGLETNVPLPGLTTNSPLETSARTASRMTVRLTPNCSANVRSGGKGSLGLRLPSKMNCSICPVTRVERVDSREMVWILSVLFMV